MTLNSIDPNATKSNAGKLNAVGSGLLDTDGAKVGSNIDSGKDFDIGVAQPKLPTHGIKSTNSKTKINTKTDTSTNSEASNPNQPPQSVSPKQSASEQSSSGEAVTKKKKSTLKGYRIKGKLGKGGMATVYLAIQESFGREVALKVMSPHLLQKRDFAARFEMEAKMVASLSHPNIITVYDVGRQGKYFYLAMEYHPAGHLGDRIKSGLRQLDAIKIGKELAEGLNHAHNHGIVHRDLKPDNILFSIRGTPVITDFGIARDNNVNTNLTQIGSTVGTPKYMSPEQARGEKVDGRSDIYGLGVIFYEMLMGKPPYKADDPVALAIKHCKDPIPTLPEHLSDYQPFIDTMMSKVPDERPKNGTAVIALLEMLEKKILDDTSAFDPTTSGISNAQKVALKSRASKPKPPSTPTPKPNKPVPRQDGYKTIPKAQKLYKEEEKVAELPYEVEDYVEGSFLSKKYTREIAFCAANYEEFEKLFTRATGDIGQWRKTHGKKAKQLNFVIEAHPWIHRRILDKLNGQFAEQHAYGEFSKFGTVTVHLYDEMDKSGEKYIVRENGKIPE